MPKTLSLKEKLFRLEEREQYLVRNQQRTDRELKEIRQKIIDLRADAAEITREN